jgi:hypothetical protein
VFRGLRAGAALDVVQLASAVAEISNIAGNRCFKGMAWEFAAAQSAGNVGTRPATHTTDAAPRPVSVEAPPMSWHDLQECRLQSAGSKCAPSPRAGFARGEGGGSGEVSLLLEKTK